jgi:nickel-dependent lactate racemase
MNEKKGAPSKSIEVSLRYGKTELVSRIEEERLLWSIAPKKVEPISDETTAITYAIDHPFGDKDIQGLAKHRSGGRIALLVDDWTRTTPHKKILPVLLDRLNKAGIPDHNITAIIAVGTHRKLRDQEILDRFGTDIQKRISFMNHDFDNAEELVNLGKTKAGTPIIVNKKYFESDIKIAVGSIVPHMYAGWSGGGKMVQPGISGGETTARTHLLAARLKFGEVLGKLHNPVREDINEVIRQAGLDFIINVVQNIEGDLIKVVAGAPIEAHRAGVASAEDVYTISLPAQAEIVLASCYPNDHDLWQAQKPLLTACLACKPKGIVLLLCPCPEVVGAEHALYCSGSSKSLDYLEELIGKSSLRDQIDAAALIGLYPYIHSRKILFISEEKARHEIEGLGFAWLGSNPDKVLKSLLNGPSYRHMNVGIIQSHAGDLVPQIREQGK